MLPAATAGAAVPLDGERDALEHEVERGVLGEPLAVVGVHVAVDEAGAGAADGGLLANEHAAEGDGVDLATLDLVPAGDDDAGAEGVAVLVADVLEERRGRTQA